MQIDKSITNKKIIKRFNTLEKEFNEIHNNFYDYSNTIYTKFSNKISILCPIHGVFEQRPNDHLKGCGCMKCANEKKSLNLDVFIERANKIHNNKFDYSESVYVIGKKIDIVCKKHGKFKQNIQDHLLGHGCKSCGKESSIKSRTMSTEDFIEKASKIHKNKYSYEKTVYVSDSKKIEITCPTHGVFKQRPGDHIRNHHGCPHCYKEKQQDQLFKPYHNKPTTLYYIKIEAPNINIPLFKLGITINSVKDRYKREIGKGFQISILNEIKFDNGKDAFELEQKLLKENEVYKFSPLEPVLFGGDSELFKEDCIKL